MHFWMHFSGTLKVVYRDKVALSLWLGCGNLLKLCGEGSDLERTRAMASWESEPC